METWHVTVPTKKKTHRIADQNEPVPEIARLRKGLSGWCSALNHLLICKENGQQLLICSHQAAASYDSSVPILEALLVCPSTVLYVKIPNPLIQLAKPKVHSMDPSCTYIMKDIWSIYTTQIAHHVLQARSLQGSIQVSPCVGEWTSHAKHPQQISPSVCCTAGRNDCIAKDPRWNFRLCFLVQLNKSRRKRPWWCRNLSQKPATMGIQGCPFSMPHPPRKIAGLTKDTFIICPLIIS